jgi:hypothetical protein
MNILFLKKKELIKTQVMVEIREVKSGRDLKAFIQFPYLLYKDDPCYVPELNISQKKMFDRNRNPFFEHSKADFFLAFIGKHPAGRIALIRNNIHIQRTGGQCGFFGFFEVINDYEVACALFSKAVEWIKNEGLTSIIGPENYTTNDSCGMLFSGFNSPPVVMMPYNKAYYNEFLKRFGFKKVMDLSSWSIGDQILKSPYIERIVRRSAGKLNASGITFRTINYKILDKEIDSLRDVYNRSNKDNWGFLPQTEKEFRETALQLKQFVPEKLVLMVEKDHRLIGYLVSVPDLNQALIHVRSGKLFPFGLLKLLWYRRRITNARILILGILEEFRNKGIDIVLYKMVQENLATLGINHVEACYILDDNLKMFSIIGKLGGAKVKQYRIYRFDL